MTDQTQPARWLRIVGPLLDHAFDFLPAALLIAALAAAPARLEIDMTSTQNGDPTMTDTLDRSAHANIRGIIDNTLAPGDDAGEGLPGAVALIAHRYQLALDALDQAGPKHAAAANHIRTAALPGPLIHTPYRDPAPQPITEQRHEPAIPGPITHAPAPLPCPVCGHDVRHHEP